MRRVQEDADRVSERFHLLGWHDTVGRAVESDHDAVVVRRHDLPIWQLAAAEVAEDSRKVTVAAEGKYERRLLCERGSTRGDH